MPINDLDRDNLVFERIITIQHNSDVVIRQAGQHSGPPVSSVFNQHAQSLTDETLDEIRQVTGNERVHMLEVDLASLASVRRLADNYRKKFDRLDVLINNAGGYFGYRKSTEDGFERTFGVNHLSHVITSLLDRSCC